MLLVTLTDSAVKVKGLVMPSLLGVTGYFGFQSAADPVSLVQATTIERVFREGGFFALVLVLLYFYRRDTKWATEFWKDQASQNVQVIKENTKAQTEIAAALRENNVIVHQAKNLLAAHLPKRRDENGTDR